MTRKDAIGLRRALAVVAAAADEEQADIARDRQPDGRRSTSDATAVDRPLSSVSHCCEVSSRIDAVTPVDAGKLANFPKGEVGIGSRDVAVERGLGRIARRTLCRETRAKARGGLPASSALMTQRHVRSQRTDRLLVTVRDVLTRRIGSEARLAGCEPESPSTKPRSSPSPMTWLPPFQRICASVVRSMIIVPAGNLSAAAQAAEAPHQATT